MLNQKKYIFFDLDGVLTDSRTIHYLAFKDSLKEVGITLSEQDHQKHFDGLPTAAKLQLLKNKYNLTKFEEQEIDRVKQKKTISLINERITTDSELISLLSNLKNYYKMCVCSNARRTTLDLTLTALGVSNFFDFTLSQQDVGSPKPSPLIYLAAQEKFKADKEECLIFEDSPHGVMAAQHSGIDYVVVENATDLKKKCLKVI